MGRTGFSKRRNGELSAVTNSNLRRFTARQSFLFTGEIVGWLFITGHIFLAGKQANEAA